MSNEVRETIEEFMFLDPDMVQFVKDNRGFTFFTMTVALFSICVLAQFLYCLLESNQQFSFTITLVQTTVILFLGTLLRVLSYLEYKRLLDIDKNSKYYADPLEIRKMLNYEFHRTKRAEYLTYSFVMFTASILMYAMIIGKYIFFS